MSAVAHPADVSRSSVPDQPSRMRASFAAPVPALAVGPQVTGRAGSAADAAKLRDVRMLVGEALSALATSPADRPFWPHQEECVRALAGRMLDGDKAAHVYSVIPSGGGKTGVFTPMVEAVATLAQVRDFPFRTVILVPTLPLVRQVLDEFAARHPHVERSYLASGEMRGPGDVRHPHGWSDMIVMTYAGFTRMAAKGVMTPSDLDLLVMDEAHRGLSDLRRETVEPFFARCVVAAFSATPEFDEDKNLDALLGRENRVYAVGPQRLRDQGVIAPVANYVLGVRMRGDLPEGRAASLLVRRKAMVDEVVAFLAEHFDERLGRSMLDTPCMFYGWDVSHAAMFAREFNLAFAGRGRRMEVVSGDDGQDRVMAVISALRNGDLSGIGNAQLLVEGLDVPKVGLVVNSSTSSIVKIVQQSGRAQRMNPDMPRDDDRQQSFVLDTYVEVNGVIWGRPRWFFEAAEGVVDARVVSRESVEVADVDVSAYAGGVAAEAAVAGSGDGDGRPPGSGPRGFAVGEAPAARRRASVSRGPFRTSADVDRVRYLVRRRDVPPTDGPIDDEWVPKTGFIQPAAKPEVHAFFDLLAAEYAERRSMLAGDEPLYRSYVHGAESSEPVAIRMSMRSSGSKTVTCYRRDCLDDLVRVSGAAMPGRPYEEGWITAADMRHAIGARWERANAALTETYRAYLVQERLVRQADRVTVAGVSVEMRRLEHDGRNYVAYSEDSVTAMRVVAGIDLDLAGPDDLDLAMMAARLGVHPKARPLVALWAALDACLSRGEPPEFNGRPVPAARKYRGGREQVVVDAAHVAAVGQAIDVVSVPRRAQRWDVTEDLPVHSEGWITKEKAFSTLRTAYRRDRPLARLWAALEDAPEIDGSREAGGVRVRMRLMRAYGRVAAYLHQDDLEAFRAGADDPGATIPLAVLAGAPSREEGWLTRTMAGQRLSLPLASPALAETWDWFAACLARDGRVVDGDREVAVRSMRTGRSSVEGMPVAPCLHESDLPWLGARLGRTPAHVASLLPKGEGDLDRKEVAWRLKVKPDQPGFATAWKLAKADVAHGRAPADLRGRIVSGSHALVLRPEGVPVFAATAGLTLAAPDLPPDYLVRDDVAAAVRDAMGGRLPEAAFNDLWRTLVESDAPEVGGQPVSVGLYRRIRREGWAMRAADVPLLVGALRKPAPAEPLAPVRDVGWERDWVLARDLPAALGYLHPTPAMRAAVAGLPAVPGSDGRVAWERGGERFAVRFLTPEGAARPVPAFARVDLARLAPVLGVAPPAWDDDAAWRPIRTFLPTRRFPVALALAEAVEARHRADVAAGKGGEPVEAWPAMPPSREDDPGLPTPRPSLLRVSLRRNKTATTLQVHASSWADAGRVMGSDLASPDASEGWMTLEDVYASIGITFNQAVDTAFRALGRRHARRLQLTGMDMAVTLVEAPGTTVRVRRVDGQPVFHPDDVRPALLALGYLKPDAVGWADRKTVAARFRVNDRTNPDFNAFWSSVEAACHGGTPLVVGGRVVRVSGDDEAARPSLREDDLDSLAATLGFVTGERTADWLDKTSAAKAVGSHVMHEGFLVAWDDLLRQAGEGTLPAGVRFERRLSRSRTPWCIHEGSLGVVGKALGAAPARVRKPAEPAWLDLDGFLRAYGVDDAGRSLVEPVWDRLTAAASAGRTVGLRTGRPRLARPAEAGATAMVHPEDAAMVAGHIGLSPPLAPAEASDWLRATVAAVRMGADQDEAERLAVLWDEAATDRAGGVVPELDASGARIRYDARGGGLLVRVHGDDVGLVAGYLRGASPSP